MNNTKEKTVVSYNRILETSMRHKEVMELAGIVKLITRYKVMIQEEMKIYDMLYDHTAKEVLIGNQSNIDRIEKYSKIIRRLHRYYNYKIEKLTKFTI